MIAVPIVARFPTTLRIRGKHVSSVLPFNPQNVVGPKYIRQADAKIREIVLKIFCVRRIDNL